MRALAIAVNLVFIASATHVVADHGVHGHSHALSSFADIFFAHSHPHHACEACCSVPACLHALEETPQPQHEDNHHHFQLFTPALKKPLPQPMQLMLTRILVPLPESRLLGSASSVSPCATSITPEQPIPLRC